MAETRDGAITAANGSTLLRGTGIINSKKLTDLFEIESDGDVQSSDAVQRQPHTDGIGPFSTPVILIVVALVIFVALIVTFG